MKKIYLLALAAFALSFSVNAQVEDNFDFYNLGDIDAQSTDWITWSDDPGGAEDADVSDVEASSGDQSLYNSVGNDMLLLLGDNTAGVWSWEYQVYLDAGSSGFLGSMSASLTEFALQMYFNDATEGTAFRSPAGDWLDTFTIPQEVWVTHRWVIDLDAGTAIVTQDGTEIYNGDFFRNALQSIDVWSDDANTSYYMDNVQFVDGLIGAADDFSADKFSVYPNPVQDILNIRSTTLVETIAIYDVLGKLVLETAPDAISPSVNMSGLTTGVYLVKVTIDGASKTVKVIK